MTQKQIDKEWAQNFFVERTKEERSFDAEKFEKKMIERSKKNPLLKVFDSVQRTDKEK